MNGNSYGAFLRKTVDSSQIITFLGEKYTLGTVEKNSNFITIEGVCDSRKGGIRQLAFCTIKNYLDSQKLTESFILIDEIPDDALLSSNYFCQVSDTRSAFIDVLSWLISSVGIEPHRPDFFEESSISSKADISSSAIIEQGVEIGAGCEIGHNVVIKSGTRIGANSVIRENTVIGCDGITVYRAQDGRLMKFPHVGGVSIGSDTEIGANTVITEGILSPTFIGNNVVVGNLCNIGHGVLIGNSVWMSVGTLIGGHTVIQDAATIAMGVSIRDNLTIGSECSIGMGSVVVKSVEANHSVFGNPAKRMPNLKTGPSR